jgi:hypothetical protein
MAEQAKSESEPKQTASMALLERHIPKQYMKTAREISESTYAKALASLDGMEFSNLAELVRNVCNSFETLNWRQQSPTSCRIPVMGLDPGKDMTIWKDAGDDAAVAMNVDRLKGFAYVVARTLMELGYKVGIMRAPNRSMVLYCIIVDQFVSRMSIPFGSSE